MPLPDLSPAAQASVGSFAGPSRAEPGYPTTTILPAVNPGVTAIVPATAYAAQPFFRSACLAHGFEPGR